MPGTIQCRGKNVYKLIVSLGSDITGKPIRKSKTFKGTEAGSKRELALFYTDCVNSTMKIDSNITLSTFFDTAVKWDILSGSPCKNKDLPPSDKKEAEFYSKDELTILFERLEKVNGREFKHRVAIMLTVFSGLRLAELMGLTWKVSLLKELRNKQRQEKLLLGNKWQNSEYLLLNKKFIRTSLMI